jgi:hypothetical protein
MTELFKSIKSPCRVKRPTEKNTMRNAILNLQVSPGSWLSGIPLAVWNLGCLESFWIPGCLDSGVESLAVWNPYLNLQV